MQLVKWIDKIGVREVSRLLGVGESTVRHWRRGHSLPRPEQMLQIAKFSFGKVRVDHIVQHYVAQKAKAKRCKKS